MTPETWRVGVLFSDTGVTHAIERTQRAATLLAIEEINQAGGVRGRKIDPIVYDPGSDPARYQKLALHLCDEDRVNVVFGCHMSSSRKAVLPIIENRGAILFYPTLYEGFEYSRHCVYTGAVPNQNSVQLVNYLSGNYGKRVFIVGSNYVYPRESNRIISELVLSIGGEVLDELYIPLDASNLDLEKVIQRIIASQPDFIYSTIVGESIVPFFKAFKASGLNAQTMPIASQSTSEADFAQLLPEECDGHITASPFFEKLNLPLAQSFGEKLKERFGPDVTATAPAEAAYFQVYLYAAALEQAGTDKASGLIPALSNVQVNAPQGLVKIDPDTLHTYLWPRVAKLNSEGQFEIVYEPRDWVAPDPFMTRHRMEPALVDTVAKRG